MTLNPAARVFEQEAMEKIRAAETAATLEDIRVHAFGKNGRMTAFMKELGGLPAEDKKIHGAELNDIKNNLTDLLDAKLGAMKNAERDEALLRDRVDMSLPTDGAHRAGSLHPVTRTAQELCRIMGQMGFALVDGPDIEEDAYNFTGLNFPPDHPAREMHDTFYLPDAAGKTGLDAKRLLRTHVSGVQVRYGSTHKPPFRIMYMGRCYRSDHDQTHSPMFHQFETMAIGKDIHMGHLKGTLLAFVQNFFEVEGDDLLRFRPSFFPFTEPSAEVDIRCDKSGGKLVMGKGDDWMEILGCGMVHPNVLRACDIDPNEYQGFAFGAGIERMAMLKYGIPDLRPFYGSDVRWLEHYGFSPMETVCGL